MQPLSYRRAVAPSGSGVNAKAGVLLDAAGLRPGSRGFRVHYDAVGTALAWARRFPAPFPGTHRPNVPSLGVFR